MEPYWIVGVFVDQFTGELFVENRKDVLGRGTFGHVHEVSDFREVKMALKMPAQHTRAKDIAKEVKFLTRLSAHGGHRNVVKFYREVNDLTGTELLFELCHPRDFLELLIKRGALLEEEVRYYGIQLLEGQAFMHERAILHRDLKPNNILVGKGMVLKIADVGMAEDIEEQYNKKFGQKVCAPGFVAPEIVVYRKHTPALDVFSMGCVLYLMTTGKLLALTTRDVALPLPDDFMQVSRATGNAKELLRRMLDYDPSTRATVPILRTLPFFHQGYCPPSFPESAFDDPPSLTNADKRPLEEESAEEEESHGAKKIRQGDKGKVAIRGHVEAKVVAAIEFEDPKKAAEVYNAEELRELELRLKDKKQQLKDKKRKLMEKRIEVRQKFGDGILLKDVRPSDDV
ncbi:Serine/threonine-protein kinase plk1 [Mortierella sp. AD032]|nr:Serine/threonine-protein kinase plk1 [Mortierella sp. AD032]